MFQRLSQVLSRPVRIASLSILSVVLSACGGGSGDDDGGGPPPPATVTISGKITFDRIAFKSSGAGLNPSAPVESPARQVTVEALDASSGDAVLATTTTNATGDYSVQVPANRNIKIRAKAETLKSGTAPTWILRVRDNTAGDALYVLDGTPASSGVTSTTRNLRAASGWGGSSYTSTRAAAPFAILDTALTATQPIASADPTTQFPALNFFWSPANRPTDRMCTADGDIVTTFFSPGETNAGNCTDPGPLSAGIYVLGDFANGNGDTDEFDQSVIAHEFGHYLQWYFSRDDSIGGSHGATDHLDPRVAFSEGWGNAWSGIVLGDPVYRDSNSGMANESGFNLELDFLDVEGWFSEFSVAEILWDLFDTTADGADQIALGFAPIYSVLLSQRDSDPLTTIFSFADALRSATSGQTAGINALLTGEQISADSDAYGNNETDADDSLTAIPIYTPIAINQAPQAICTSATYGAENKLGNSRYLVLSLASPAAVSITASGAVIVPPAVAATDPDIYVYRRGTIVASGVAIGPTEIIPQQLLAAGTYIIEVYDYDLSGTNSIPHCMSVSVSGT